MNPENFNPQIWSFVFTYTALSSLWGQLSFNYKHKQTQLPCSYKRYKLLGKHCVEDSDANVPGIVPEHSTKRRLNVALFGGWKHTQKDINANVTLLNLFANVFSIMT